MCLAVPGKLISLTDTRPLIRTGQVSFGGVVKEINMAFVPEATVGDYVLVHAGIAIGIIDQEKARNIFDYIAQYPPPDDSGEKMP